MKKEDIVRAWKDEEFAANLSPETKALLPENPAGVVDLSDEELESASGGSCQTAPNFCPDEASC